MTSNMQQNEYKAFLRETKGKGEFVEITLRSKGWEIFEQILAFKLSEWNNIEKISTLKQLEAHKVAKKIIEETINEYKSLVNEAYYAGEDLKKIGEESTSE